MNIAFEHPYAFLLLIFALCFFLCPRSPLSIYFVRNDLLPRFGFHTKWFVLLSFIFMVIALAQPFRYSSFELGERRGRDLALVIDASGSMEENFGQKSKFDTVKEMAMEFFKHRYNDNIAIVIFGSFAYIAAPLTYDTKALEFIIQYLEPSIAGNNTAIGDGLYQAIKALEKGKAKEKVIVLISDGQQNSGKISPKEAVDLAKKRNITIYTIGLGDVDKALMQKIAKQSGGKFFYAKSPKDLEEIFQTLDSLEPSPIRSGHYVDKRPLFYPFLLLAFVLFLIPVSRIVK